MHLHFRNTAALIFMMVVTVIPGYSDDQIQITINDNDWGRMGSFAGVNRNVYAMTSWKDTLYVGGALSFAGTDSVHNIARWDGKVWSALGFGH